MNLPNNGRYGGILIVEAHQTGGSSGTAGDGRSWIFAVSAKRGANAAATALVYATQLATGGDAATSGWTVAVTADTTNGGIAVTVTGEANKTVRWVARFADVEVTA